MTVSSLWKALDKGGSGRAVDAHQLANPRAPSNAIHTQQQQPLSATNKPQTLAVDLSIWICESLTSYGMNEQNANPALHLVFTRTMKLLNLGVNLVFVIEGKQRIRDFSNNEAADKFRKRRSGTAFWKACNDCQTMLGHLGVPVVRAKSEGEALCALLCQRGVVDGVISNDGDCLVFGATTIYTKFSNENLDNGRVIRYDLDSLYATVEASDDPDIVNSETGTIQLSRADLISFALLTGSDLVGAGLSKVGHKKAIRFIRKCQQDNPLSKQTASLDELKSWGIAASADAPVAHNHHDDAQQKGVPKCCSRCNHAGSKRSHEKHGCTICGTEPGEPCYLVTTEDRFRKSLRAKALAMRNPKFDPSQVHVAYMQPNDNQLPIQFVGTGGSGAGVHMSPPCLGSLMSMKLIVKGRILEGSRTFVRQHVTRLLSRNELYRSDPPSTHFQHQQGGAAHLQRIARERPVAKAITKALTQNQVPCYEVTWIVNATATDANGEEVDGYEYKTVEPRNLIERKYPKLVEAFRALQVERAKQGSEMKKQRRNFLENVLFAAPGEPLGENKKRKPDKRRADFFEKNKSMPLRDYQATARKRSRRRGKKAGDDVGNLLRFAACEPLPFSPAKTQADPHDKENFFGGEFLETPQSGLDDKEEELLFCRLGCFEVQITPIESNHGVYPPKNIFLHHNR